MIKRLLSAKYDCLENTIVITFVGDDSTVVIKGSCREPLNIDKQILFTTTRLRKGVFKIIGNVNNGPIKIGVINTDGSYFFYYLEKQCGCSTGIVKLFTDYKIVFAEYLDQPVDFFEITNPDKYKGLFFYITYKISKSSKCECFFGHFSSGYDLPISFLNLLGNNTLDYKFFTIAREQCEVKDVIISVYDEKGCILYKSNPFNFLDEINFSLSYSTDKGITYSYNDPKKRIVSEPPLPSLGTKLKSGTYCYQLIHFYFDGRRFLKNSVRCTKKCITVPENKSPNVDPCNLTLGKDILIYEDVDNCFITIENNSAKVIDVTYLDMNSNAGTCLPPEDIFRTRFKDRLLPGKSLKWSTNSGGYDVNILMQYEDDAKSCFLNYCVKPCVQTLQGDPRTILSVEATKVKFAESFYLVLRNHQRTNGNVTVTIPSLSQNKIYFLNRGQSIGVPVPADQKYFNVTTSSIAFPNLSVNVPLLLSEVYNADILDFEILNVDSL